MTKRFIFTDPEQIKEISPMTKKGGAFGSVLNVAKVWKSARSQKDKTPWDGKIGVEFSTDGKSRRAFVYRVGTDGKKMELAQLKYTLALNWCQANLMQVE